MVKEIAIFFMGLVVFIIILAIISNKKSKVDIMEDETKLSNIEDEKNEDTVLM